MIFKVYICQGPEKHISEGAHVSDLFADPASRACSQDGCYTPVIEVEVVRVDDLLGDEAIEGTARWLFEEPDEMDNRASWTDLCARVVEKDAARPFGPIETAAFYRARARNLVLAALGRDEL